MLPDWHQLHAADATTPAVVDSRLRLRILLAAFAVSLLVVLGRAVELEVTQGAVFRAEAARRPTREKDLPGVRGRILARDGTVLAFDRQVLALAVHYRYLEEPPDARWLRWQVRSRLTQAQCKDPQRTAAEAARVREDRRELARRLAGLCGLSTDQWNARARKVQSRVRGIAESVNRRRLSDAPPETPPEAPPSTLAGRIGRFLRDSLQGSPEDAPPEWIIVAEELDYHVMAEDVPLAVVAEIEGNPGQYPGAKILKRTRRAYPAGPMAAHVLGHLGRIEKDELNQRDRRDVYQAGGYRTGDFVGRTGLERQHESLLHGRRGVAVETTDHGGHVLATRRKRPPDVGRDLVLTLDVPLQHAAEKLLDEALQRRADQNEGAEPAGGAIVVMDVETGALRAAASAPRFDPNWFLGGHDAELTALLTGPAHPLVDRVGRMALPPGSVFKTLTAVALLETGTVKPEESFFCQGYLHEPDRQRCAIYRRRGVGHGRVTLADALCVSCNVYFFHHAGKLGPKPLGDWADRFGFGRPTGIDLPGEATGMLPTPTNIGRLEGHPWRPGDTHSVAIGQGSLTATPLQVVQMMAAVANGGRLVTPHLVSRLGLRESTEAASAQDSDDPIRVPPPRPIPGLQPETSAAIREGLSRVVSGPAGTAHGTLRLDSIAVAGKTGTAETGGDRGDHAWFAGYVPAEQPKLAFVVVLEYAGNAATTACPVAKRLVLQMERLGLL